jgi:hypothetical protein
MKAAEVSARRGARVTLLERRGRLGGQLRLAASVAGRSEIGQVVTHLETQLGKLEVDVRLNVQAAPEDVLALDPDRVIVATGSAPSADVVGNIAQGIRELPGLDLPHVVNVWDVLEGDVDLGSRVLVVDDGEGSWKAIGLALDLDQRGHEVHLSTPLPYVGAKIGPFSQHKLVPRIFASGIETHAFASLVEVRATSVTLSERGSPVTIEGVESVVLAGWNRPVADVYFALKREGVDVERVGDAIACRTMLEAVHEGERAARRD